MDTPPGLASLDFGAVRALARRLDPQRLRRTLGAARCLREPGRFVRNELRDVPTQAAYHLRHAGLVAHVRHPLLDMWVLEEVFRFRVYEPPPPAARLLQRLGRPVRIVDLGGHVGFFGLFMQGRFPHSEIVSFEPDPGSAGLLRRTIQRNALQDRWRVIEACAAPTDGSVDFTSSYHLSRMGPGAQPSLEEMHRRVTRAFGFMQGSALLTAQRRQVASRDVFPFLIEADLIKIDIEGAEWELLADPRFGELRAPAVVLEYHPVDHRGEDAEEDARRRLEQAGYDEFAAGGGTDAGLLWAWRRRSAAASAAGAE